MEMGRTSGGASPYAVLGRNSMLNDKYDPDLPEYSHVLLARGAVALGRNGLFSD